MKLSSKTISRIIVSLTFGAFFILSFLQFSHVGLYFDDFGYYSLNYCVATEHSGHIFTISQLINFLKEHYQSVSGRLPYFFIWLCVYKMGGLTAVRLMAALILTLAMYSLYRVALISSAFSHNISIALGICLSFGLISIDMHRHSTYWMTAFFLYYTPILIISFFALAYDKHSKHPLYTFLLCILSFLGSWSFESFSVAVVGLMLLLFAYASFSSKKVAFRELLYFVSALAGALILFTSPGIWQRANSASEGAGLISRIMESISLAFIYTFSPYQRFYLISIFASAAIICLYLYTKTKHPCDIICMTVSSLVAVAEILNPNIVGVLAGFGWQGIALYTVMILALAVTVVRYIILIHGYSQLILLLVALLSMMALALVPNFPSRVILPFVLISFLLVGDAANILGEYVMENRKSFRMIIPIFILFVYAAVSIRNGMKIYKGYSANHQINVYNDTILTDAALRAESGEHFDEIILKKLPEETSVYSSTMYYDCPDDWFKGMILNYYGLDKNITITYQ